MGYLGGTPHPPGALDTGSPLHSLASAPHITACGKRCPHFSPQIPYLTLWVSSSVISCQYILKFKQNGQVP